jgi:hypothetical protein
VLLLPSSYSRRPCRKNIAQPAIDAPNPYFNQKSEPRVTTKEIAASSATKNKEMYETTRENGSEQENPGKTAIPSRNKQPNRRLRRALLYLHVLRVALTLSPIHATAAAQPPRNPNNNPNPHPT